MSSTAAIEERRLALEARVGVALGSSPGRVELSVRRRARSGELNGAQASRSEVTSAIEIGARY